jgi:multidrug transporter EmrE-like cation transporter
MPGTILDKNVPYAEAATANVPRYTALPLTRREWSSGLIWIISSVLAQTAANVFAKKAALDHSGQGLIVLVWNEWNALQLVALGCQACFWIMTLRKFALSLAYPLTSLVIALNLLCAWWIFDESIQMHHLLGVGLIIVGVTLIGSRAKV